MVAMAAPVDMAKHTVNMPGKMTKTLNVRVATFLCFTPRALQTFNFYVILDLTIQIYKNNFVDVV